MRGSLLVWDRGISTQMQLSNLIFNSLGFLKQLRLRSSLQITSPENDSKFRSVPNSDAYVSYFLLFLKCIKSSPSYPRWRSMKPLLPFLFAKQCALTLLDRRGEIIREGGFPREVRGDWMYRLIQRITRMDRAGLGKPTCPAVLSQNVYSSGAVCTRLRFLLQRGRKVAFFDGPF